MNYIFILLSCLLSPLGSAMQPEYSPEAFKGYSLVSFEITGLEKELLKELRRGLALPAGIKRFRRGRPVFYPANLEQDIKRTKLFLAQNGYPYARIHPQITLVKETSVALVLFIQRGPPVTIDSLVFEGVPAAFDEDPRTAVHISSGSIFVENRIAASVNALHSKLLDEGFARATVASHIDPVDSLHVVLTFEIDPGARFYLGALDIDGADPDLVPLIRKTAHLVPGTLYSPGLIQRARDDIRLLDLFRQVRLNTVADAQDTLGVHIGCAMRESKTISAAVGYWTDELVRFRAHWMHRNLFKRGRGAGVSLGLSRFLQSAESSVWWPALLGSRTRLTSKVNVERQNEDSYTLLQSGWALYASYRHSLATSVRFGISVSNVDLSIETEQTGAFMDRGGLLSIVSAQWQRNGSNDRLFPTAGSVLWIRGEWAPPGPVSESHFALLEASGTVYLSLSQRVVVAGRLTSGIASPTGESMDLLPNKRFYSGGASSMRGFKRRKLGPLDSVGAPLGGESKLEASMEIRFPLVWRFMGALFVDTGQVWQRYEAMRPGDVAIAAGPGVSIRTPVGPVRMDAGFLLTEREATQPRTVFHLSIGYPY